MGGITSIVVGVLAAVVGAATVWFLGYLLVAPRVYVEFRSGWMSHRFGTTDGRRACRWSGALELENRSPHDAYDVRIEVFPSTVKLGEYGPMLLSKGTKREIGIWLIKEFDRQDFRDPAPADPLADLDDDRPSLNADLLNYRPPELENFVLLLEYRNSRGKRCL